MDNKHNEHSQQNIIALLKHIKEENNNYKGHNNDNNNVLTSSTAAMLPFEIHKVVEQKKQYVQMSPEIIQYQVQTYQTPINRVDNNNSNSNIHNVKQDSLIIESIHKGSNVTFSNDTAKTNPSPFQHCQMISDGITDTQQISTPNLDYNYDINTYNSFLTQINPKTFNNNIRTPSPKKKLKLSKSTNNFFTDKSDLFFNTSLLQNGLLNITDSKTYQMGKPSNYENDLIIKKSFINNKFKNKMSEYIISNNNNNKYKYSKTKSKTQKSKSLNHNTIRHPRLNDNYCINGNGNIKHVNKNELFRKGKKISLMMNILKNPNDKDLVLEIARGMREEKGGVVDFALIKNDKCSSSSSQIVKYGKNSLCINNKKVISSAKIIQRWWRNIIYIYNMLNIKVIKIQSVYRGWYYRCLLNNNRNKLKGNVLILKEEEQQQMKRCKCEELLCCCNGVNNIEVIQCNDKEFKEEGMRLMKNVLVIYLYRVFNEFMNKVNRRIKKGDVIDKGVNGITGVLRKNVMRAKFMNDPLTRRLREKCLKSIIRNKDNNINNKLKTCFTKWKMNLYSKNNKCKIPLDFIVTSSESVCSYLHQIKRPIINEISFEDAFSYMNRPKCKLQSILSTINECELYYNSLLKVKSFKQIFPSKVNELDIISHNITNNKQQPQLLPLSNARIEYTITPLIKQNLLQISKSNLNIYSLPHKQTPNIIENTHDINITPIHSNIIKPFTHVIQPQTSVHSFKSTPNPLKHLPNEDNSINIQPQPPLQNENGSLIMKNKKRFLTKQITINDLRNKISLHLAFTKWYRKSLALKNKKRVNVRKRLLPNDNEIQNILYKNLFRYVITQIQNEAKRRRIIKLFYYLERLKLPIQHYAFSKIKEYTNAKYKLMNLYAMLIQRYYRLKYKNGNNMLLIEDNEIIKSTQIIIEETYPQHYAFQYKTYVTGDDNTNNHNTHSTKQYVSLAHLMDDFFRKYTIRHIIELLYCVYYKQ